jgi:hypothetical protein
MRRTLFRQTEERGSPFVTAVLATAILALVFFGFTFGLWVLTYGLLMWDAPPIMKGLMVALGAIAMLGFWELARLHLSGPV